MLEFPFIKRLYYTFLGYLFWLTYATESRVFLGIRYSTWIKLGAAGLVLAGLLYRWGRFALYGTLGLLLGLLFIYWLARRASYFRFVASPQKLTSDQAPGQLAPYQRVPVTATGIYSLQLWEKNVLLRPAAYWQAPRGDHAIMVEHKPGKYLYQFFKANMVRDVRQGWLIHGPQPRAALSVRFLSIWGPEFSETRYSIFGEESKPADPTPRAIYLSFDSLEAERVVCHNVVNDVQQARLIDKR